MEILLRNSSKIDCHRELWLVWNLIEDGLVSEAMVHASFLFLIENTRVVGQKELDHFRSAIAETNKDPYSFVLRTKQLPLGLVIEDEKQKHMHLLDADPFDQTFGPKAQRKKPKLAVSDMAELASHASQKLSGYCSDDDQGLPSEDAGIKKQLQNPIFQKGQSKRIWNELYKVIDSSDVVIHGIQCFFFIEK
jgi:nuclear GTP-binding protein